ncbi:hypothetical protein K493DRAFT_9885 [Basidiobolus meristosporus CBS 931.73]|uniref:G-protein coupled receptors family 2 profile 2 domain-containing protein n=1 Tax=Basidiobolus meristosporus CBS 931.73 TaxID=1314790 RepID=A0A1Y1YJB7_9FUNG|nr:hypothetical protein K493DRAFT_9885 [Basidiobolus meristosporus CBS 931.73]|eukprot:ORX98048.1 hypothetical protein K493DRAFT_9885 [Basidiobolus meristosporus CBS 931.73]
MTTSLDKASWDYDPGYDLRLLEGAQVIQILNISLNSASIICGSLVLVVYFLIRSYEPKLMDRVSLRLTAVISLVDVLRAATYIAFTFITSAGPGCKFSAWAILFLTNYYVFLTCMIAFNLQYVFLHYQPYQNRLERKYFLVSTTLSFATTLPALIWDRVGWDDSTGACWWRHYSAIRTKIWEWGSFLIWVILGTIYCTVVVVLVVIKLQRNKARLKVLNEVSPPDEFAICQSERMESYRTVNRLVTRITLYILIPIVTQGGFILMEIWLQFKHTMNPGINYWSVIGTDLSGQECYFPCLRADV